MIPTVKLVTVPEYKTLETLLMHFTDHPQRIDLFAQRHLATQSSSQYQGTPDKAVDGDTNQNYFGGSCIHTRSNGGTGETDPWWTVPLPGRYMISQVNIY